MKILLTLALACALLSQVSSLECYKPSDSSCSNKEVTEKCKGNQTKCASFTRYTVSTPFGASDMEYKQSDCRSGRQNLLICEPLLEHVGINQVLGPVRS
ncbi:hypothetical protein GJAV_G00000460 [Gymnothorax javanicus]|nr:hypothetical protein GJAV_G00000460 [Gymnothorax javanicus]